MEPAYPDQRRVLRLAVIAHGTFAVFFALGLVATALLLLLGEIELTGEAALVLVAALMFLPLAVLNLRRARQRLAEATAAAQQDPGEGSDR